MKGRNIKRKNELRVYGFNKLSKTCDQRITDKIMEIILTISSIIIIVLMAFVLFLSFKVIQYKRRCKRYEILENSSLSNEWQKFSRLQTQIPINREKDNDFNVNNTCNRVINNRMEGPLNSSLDSKHWQKDLLSAQGMHAREDNRKVSGRSRSEGTALVLKN